MRRVIARLATAIALTGAVSLAGVGVTASAAQASEPVDMNIACQLANGQSGWRANLDYPSQGGYGWRCWLPGHPEAGRPGVNIEYYCQYYFGLHARGGSTAYNWRCDY